MQSAQDFYVFDKWHSAPEFAFGKKNQPGVVPLEDREAYWRVYLDLNECADEARRSSLSPDVLVVHPKQYSRGRGSRGHRPVDLYVSICGAAAGTLGWYPQVYAIASQRGLEVGFAASISEEDYFDQDVKARNRAIVPFINGKLPEAGDPLVSELDGVLEKQGGWHFNAKTRLGSGSPGFDQFASLANQISHLKKHGAASGGGTVCRIFPPEALAQIELNAEFSKALDNFLPLIARCAPTPWDVQVRHSQLSVEAAHEDAFDPANVEDGRNKVLTEVARRQGQGKFRVALLDAYAGRCTISGTRVPDVLQAAHITPYRGPMTNHVTNGLLLRADLHTLFDLGLIRIDPDSLCVAVSPALKDSSYWEFDGQPILLPAKPSGRPSSKALAAHFSSGTNSENELSLEP